MLQAARAAGLPLRLTGSEAACRAMWDWDRASGPSKAQVIEELITWLPVWLEQPEIGRTYDFEDLHPAANVLDSVGLEAAVPLQNRLLADPDSAQAELMTRTLQRVYDHSSDLQNEHLVALKARTSSARLKTIIDQVDQLTRRRASAKGDEEDEEVVVPAATPTPVPK